MLGDRFNECFEKITPQNNLTFSHRPKPCRYEPSLRHGDSFDGCPFLSFCLTIENSKLSGIISNAYSELTKNTLSESSTSIVVRSEQQFHSKDLFRTTQRRHLYEVVRNGTNGNDSRFGIGCSILDSHDRLGEYLGFIDLREHYNKSPLAFALLVEPGSIREDPNAFIIRGDYGPLFGAHSFQSTVYSMQDLETAGAVCAQACVIMCLGMLGDRRSSIKGSFTVTFLAYITQLASERKARDGNTQRTIEDYISEIRLEISDPNTRVDYPEFNVGGMSDSTIRDVLRQCNVSAETVDIKAEALLPNATMPASDKHVLRVIEANVRARFPVILIVNGVEWQGGNVAQSSDCKINHAIVIVGFRKNAKGEVSSLIVHDPASMPFLERSPSKTLAAARNQETVRNDGPSGFYSLVIAAENGLTTHAHQCINWLKEHEPNFRRFYLCDGGTDYRIFAANSRSILRILRSEGLSRADFVGARIELLPGVRRVWCVACYVDGKLYRAWFFDANAMLKQYVLKIFFEDEGNAYRVLRPLDA